MSDKDTPTLFFDFIFAVGEAIAASDLLPTLHEWCCHHPCKARFRLAGSPLPEGS